MTTGFHWVLPTEGDGRDRTPRTPPDPTATPAHWVAVARAAEQAGFDALQVPSGTHRPDAWLVASLLARHTRRLKFLVAFRPGFVLPAAAAQAAASLQQLTGQRLLVGVLAGGDIAEHRAHGDLVNHDDRFARAAEFLSIVRQFWRGRPGGIGVRHQGAHYRIENGGLVRPLRQPPPLHVGGLWPAAERVAAEHADVYSLWADTPARFEAQVRRVQALAAAHGRTLHIACRVHVISRHTEADAWHEAERQLDTLAQRPATARELEVSPQLWAGHGLLRGAGAARAGTALVGSHRQVAARLDALVRLGANTFVLSGDRSLDDAFRVSEEVLPLMRPGPAPAGNAAAGRAREEAAA